MSAIIGFLAEINQVRHRAAVFKFNGTDVHWWTWEQAITGTFWHDDLRTGKTKVFSQIQDFHGSYHESGQRHDKVVAAGRVNDVIGVFQGVSLRDIRQWQALKTLAVPLEEPFHWDMRVGPWKEVETPILLRKEEFGDIYGVNLHGYLCYADSIDELVSRWKLKHWTAGDDELRLVVLVEPYKKSTQFLSQKS
jgi:hypothetical protein